MLLSEVKEHFSPRVSRTQVQSGKMFGKIETIRSWRPSWKPVLVFTAYLLLAFIFGAFSAAIPSGQFYLPMIFGLLVTIWLMYYHPHLVVYLLVAIVPLEEVLLKHLPVSDRVYIASRFLSESVIYTSFLILIIRKVVNKERFRRTPVDFYLIGFVLVAGLTVLINQPPLLGSLVNLRALLRYTVLFYLVVNLDFNEKQIRRILVLIVLAGALEVVIGWMQLIFGDRINSFLLPKTTEIEIAGYSRGFVLLRRGRELGAIFGTLGDTIFYALFMLVVLAVILGQAKTVRLHHVIFIFLLFLSVNFAYARAAVFGIFLMIAIAYRVRAGRTRLISMLILILLVVLLGTIFFYDSTFIQREFVNPLTEQQNILQNVTGIFTIDYFQRAQSQRLGALTGIPPIVLSTSPMLGFGPDEDHTINKLNEYLPDFDLPLFKQKAFRKNGFEDVYWAALLAYYGLLGLGIFIVFLLRFYKSIFRIYNKTRNPLTKNLAVTAICIVGVSMYLLFFYRVLEFRAFSFYFWLFPGLLFSLYSQEHSGGNYKTN